MRIPEEPDDLMQINIVPMIDVIFAILAFFIISTLFLTRMEGLPVDLPEASNSESGTQSEVVVTIKPNGDLALNREPVELEILAEEIEAFKGEQSRMRVVINGDEGADYGRVVAVLDVLRGIEGTEIAISTKQPGSDR
jgi:biopolymer transport protein ExbD